MTVTSHKCHDVSNYLQLHWWFNCFFRLQSVTTAKLCIACIHWVNPPVTGGFPSQRASNVVSIPKSWCHRVHEWEGQNFPPGKMSSYQYRKSHCGDKIVVRSSHLHNGISYTGKMASLYWFSPWIHCKITMLEMFLMKFWSPYLDNSVAQQYSSEINYTNFNSQFNYENTILLFPIIGHHHSNTLRPRHNGRHFPDDIFKCIFLNENV